ncbi:interferon-inducible GTPase-domain-containing protein [Suillus clintonianus]|uniref:interferon-inducible GTPase-domain-containing protein n=1 Tax=Suillus clintonianus TaxID=1904413 RepID=UPI001B8831F1|nr:interferon-inducible GTPase-domain-containing protein [Suillus clintonianus]KAG2122231.1 interferon-inducible GTPase-domain-containing protein [Suillus clintonianus]
MFFSSLHGLKEAAAMRASSADSVKIKQLAVHDDPFGHKKGRTCMESPVRIQSFPELRAIHKASRQAFYSIVKNWLFILVLQFYSTYSGQRCWLKFSLQSLRIPVHHFRAHSEMGVLFSRPEAPNPSLEEIKARQEAEAAAAEARKDAEDARAHIAQLIQSHQESQQKAMEAQRAAMQTMAAEQEQAQKEMIAMFQAERAANEARFLAEAAAHAAGEEAKQRAAEAEEERKRTAAIQEQARKDAQAAREQVKVANAAKEDAERKLKKGIQPVVTPTAEQVRTAKRKVDYREDLFHFAVAGVAGGGKSSLINAFRGLRKKDSGYAPTGVTETTLAMARYPDAKHPYAWYDIPGAGTLKIPDWQYFNAQGLYVFDCIIILFDNRFTVTDIAILTNCRRFKIPTYIVRSKADQHILNITKEMEYDSDDDEGGDQKKKLDKTARQQFIQQTRQSVKDNLADANMPDQRVYIVSNETMCKVVKEKRPKDVIDELELLNDLIGESKIRRAQRDTEAETTATGQVVGDNTVGLRIPGAIHEAVSKLVAILGHTITDAQMV